jgi:hypothetical protein
MLRMVAGTPAAGVATLLSALATLSVSLAPEFGFIFAPMAAAWLPMFTSYRASPFEAALPIDARRITMARIGVALVHVWLPIGAWMAAGPRSGGGWELVVLAAATVLTLLPYTIRPGVLGVSASRLLAGPYAGVALACGIGILLMHPLVLAAVLALVAVITAAVIWRATPPSFQLAPAAAPAPAPRLDVSTPVRTPEDVQWWRPMIRSVVPPRTLGVAAMVGFMGFSDQWLFYFVMFAIADAAFTRHRNNWMRTLPIPRRALLGMTLVPFLLPLLGILLVGKLAIAQIPPLYADLHSIDDGAPHAFSRAHDFDRHTKVPLAFWKRAPDERPPVIRAPWGETTGTDALSVLGRPFYNPYSVRTQNSERFREWQFARATTAVYGRPISLAEYEAEDFVPPRRVTSAPPIYILGGALTLTLSLFMAWAVEFTSWHRLGRRPILRTTIQVTLWLLGFVLVVGIDLYYLIRHGSVVLIPLATAWLMTVAERLGSMPAVLLGALIPVLAMYAVLRWQFNRSEWGAEWAFRTR